jgi:UDP-sulfoquinovose synthase
MKKHEGLINRFDYDGIYGTVLNRFISQAANGFPLTVYGSGGQTRAFIHISDTAKCIQLAIKSPPKREGSVRIFNQVSEVLNVKQLAEIISEQYGTDIQYVQNPRKELRENELEVENSGLKSIGFNPITLKNALLDDIKYIADSTKKSFDQEKVLNSPKW